jgi:hypothetical protein
MRQCNWSANKSKSFDLEPVIFVTRTSYTWQYYPIKYVLVFAVVSYFGLSHQNPTCSFYDPLRATFLAYLILLDLFWLYLAKDKIFEARHYLLRKGITSYLWSSIKWTLLEISWGRTAWIGGHILHSYSSDMQSRVLAAVPGFLVPVLWMFPSIPPGGCRNITFKCVVYRLTIRGHLPILLNARHSGGLPSTNLHITYCLPLHLT